SDIKRECLLKALAVYLGEDPTTLVTEYLDVHNDDAQQSTGATVLGIYVIRCEGAEARDSYQDVGIIVEGLTVLQNLRSVAHACALMLGLAYALNLAYPDGLKYTFEVLQKLLLELEPTRLSKKVQVLKNKLLE
uniref:Uncharacterized protein n=1 Tax=Paramormyrops kingsleyae TaxID=1676925 RepID=A0A3B3S4F1_9TELE